jgi:NIPSNAP
MKRYRITLSATVLIAMGLIGFSAGMSVGQGQNTRVYELRTYTTLPGRLPALNKRFAEHTIELFEKHGMKSEIYWAPTDEPLKDNTLIYVISHESREAADKNWKEFQADPDWIKARDESEADGKISRQTSRAGVYDGNRIFTQEIGAARGKPPRRCGPG